MNENFELPAGVRIEGELVVITEDNVSLTPSDMANILIELHNRGCDLKKACLEAGIEPFTPKFK